MPRPPEVASSVGTVRASLFSKLAEQLDGFSGESYPLHVGDTWMPPPPGSRMEDLETARYPGLHRYAPPQGLPELIEALVEEDRLRTGLPTGPENLLVTAGATGALGAAAGALLEPGEEVLVLAPHWPLITGIVRSFHGVPRVVPFYDRVDGPEAAVEAVAAHLGAATVALYVNSPNNPSGRILPESWLTALVEWARRENLWLLADDVYEHYAYRGRHAPLRRLAPERTLAAFSFSKAYGMAGNRCGYVLGPGETVAQLQKVSTHTFYSTPTASQVAALRVLSPAGTEWRERAAELYRREGERAASRLGVAPPESGTFLFLDLADHLDDRGLGPFLQRCVENGLLVAPGPSFGPYPSHVRVCFTALEPERTFRGIELLAELLGR